MVIHKGSYNTVSENFANSYTKPLGLQKCHGFLALETFAALQISILDDIRFAAALLLLKIPEFLSKVIVPILELGHLFLQKVVDPVADDQSHKFDKDLLLTYSVLTEPVRFIEPMKALSARKSFSGIALPLYWISAWEAVIFSEVMTQKYPQSCSSRSITVVPVTTVGKIR